MFFLQFVQYLSFLVGTPKNEIPGAALELCQLKIKQFTLDILKSNTKHEDNAFPINCFMVPRTFLFIFHADSRRLGSNTFRNSNYSAETAGSARVSFHFLWLWWKQISCCQKKIYITHICYHTWHNWCLMHLTNSWLSFLWIFSHMVDWDFTFSALYMFAYRKKFNQMDQVG